jgi:two-component system nitrate/nitrite response regulator NarL
LSRGELALSDVIRVAILDDHPAIIGGYLARLRESQMIQVVGTAVIGEAMEEILSTTPVDVLLLDLSVPVSDQNPSPYPVLLAIPHLLDLYQDMKVLVISMHNQLTLIQAVMEAGARGYILKDDRAFMNDLPAIIETVAHGGSYFSSQAYEALFRPHSHAPALTQRQIQALSLCAAYPQESTMELAARMEVAGSTMRNLLSSAYIVLRVHSRVAAVAKAQKSGYIQPLDQLLDLRVLSGDDAELETIDEETPDINLS